MHVTIDRSMPTQDGPEATAAQAAAEAPPPDDDLLVPASLLVSSRRGFLRGALVAAGGAAAATLAACAPATGSAWSYAPQRSMSVAAGPTEDADPATTDGEPIVTSAAAETEPLSEGDASSEPLPDGWTEHDMAAREKVRRFVGNLAGPLGMTAHYTHTRPETQRREIERALRLWPESLFLVSHKCMEV